MWFFFCSVKCLFVVVTVSIASKKKFHHFDNLIYAKLRITVTKLIQLFSLQSDQGEQSQIVYHLSPGQSRTANELTEEEKVRVAQREGLIDHLPRNTWDENHVANKKVRE